MVYSIFCLVQSCTCCVFLLLKLYHNSRSISILYFPFQPAPQQYDHSIDESDHTVEEWKGGQKTHNSMQNALKLQIQFLPSLRLIITLNPNFNLIGHMVINLVCLFSVSKYLWDRSFIFSNIGLGLPDRVLDYRTSVSGPSICVPPVSWYGPLDIPNRPPISFYIKFCMKVRHGKDAKVKVVDV